MHKNDNFCDRLLDLSGGFTMKNPIHRGDHGFIDGSGFD